MNYVYLAVGALVAGAFGYGAYSDHSAKQEREASAAGARRAAADRRRAHAYANSAKAEAERQDRERLGREIAATANAASQAAYGHMTRLDRQKGKQPLWSARRRSMARLRDQLKRRAGELEQVGQDHEQAAAATR